MLKKKEIKVRSSVAEYLIYAASAGDQKDSVEIHYEDENIWLTQKMMATLYDVDVCTISEYIEKIYTESELEQDKTVRKFQTVQTESSSQITQEMNYYNLRMIIAVGFRINNERLKRGTYLTQKYFDEQLERIREIRASERNFYQKITDLYATAIDHDKNAAATKRFYAAVQDKMHYAVYQHTATELITERADHTKDHMGLTIWADAPDGKIKKSDVTVANNYLSEKEKKRNEKR